MPRGKSDKPRGRMSSYAYFVKICREEHQKKHPGENVVFTEFSRKCSEKWKEMSAKEKLRFEEMAAKDKIRYDSEMSTYTPPQGEAVGKGRKRKHKKDPNAPKRALSAFFFFCADERPALRKQFPDYSVGDIAKDLGKMWAVCKDKPKYDVLAAKDKKRYEIEKLAYEKGGKIPLVKKPKPQPLPQPEVQEEEEEEEEEEEDDDDDAE
ncbi:high mobility group protein B2-like [Gigantopelta aegis]|uniref:high mobility group protein B2-like n=1 Tax=Gigantopelta aegis TaxID=1735272 RepID=UPI001B88D096|nr:high mobility group protein B2-like [Gigantopelta aegis]